MSTVPLENHHDTSAARFTTITEGRIDLLETKGIDGTEISGDSRKLNGVRIPFFRTWNQIDKP